jgi:hypothetical protein
MDGLDSIPDKDRNSSLCLHVQTHLGLARIPIQRVPRVKRSWRDAREGSSAVTHLGYIYLTVVPRVGICGTLQICRFPVHLHSVARTCKKHKSVDRTKLYIRREEIIHLFDN